MLPLLKGHAAALGPLLAKRANDGQPLPDWLLKRHNLQKLPADSIKQIGCTLSKKPRELAQLLQALPPSGRAQMLESIRLTVPLSSSVEFLAALRGERLRCEAEKLLAQPDCTGTHRLEALSWLPLDTVQEELSASCRVSDEEER